MYIGLRRSCGSLHSPLIGCCVAIVIAFTNYHAARQIGHSAKMSAHARQTFAFEVLKEKSEG